MCHISCHILLTRQVLRCHIDNMQPNTLQGDAPLVPVISGFSTRQKTFSRTTCKMWQKQSHQIHEFMKAHKECQPKCQPNASHDTLHSHYAESCVCCLVFSRSMLVHACLVPRVDQNPCLFLQNFNMAMFDFLKSEKKKKSYFST